MNNKINHLLKYSLLSLGLSLNSLTSQALTLQEALKHAYDNNDIIKTNQYKYNKDSLAPYTVLENSILPQITASAGANKTYKYEADGLFSNSRETALGGSNNSANAEIQANLNLYQNGVTYNSFKQAQYSKASSENEYYEQEQDFFLRNAITHYFDYIKAKEINEIIKQRLNFANKQYEQARLKLNLGEGTKVELSSAKSQLSKVKARIHDSQTKLNNARRNFIKTFGLEPENLKTPELPTVIAEANNCNEIDNNPTLKKLYNSKLGQEKTYNVRLGAAGPRVDLTASSGLSSGFDDNFNLGDKATRSNTIGIKLTWSFPSNYTEIRKQKYNMIASNYQFEEAKKSVGSQLQNAYDLFNSLKEQNNSLNEAEEAAKIALEAAEKSHKLGSLSMLDVLKRENDYSQTKEELAEIKHQIYIRSYEILSLKGELTAEKLGLVDKPKNKNK